MIKDRILQVIDYKGITKEIFFKKIEMTSANFRGNAKKTPLNSRAIKNILSEIPDLNLEWLITGKGNMLKDNTPVSINNEGIMGNNIKGNVNKGRDLRISDNHEIKGLVKQLSECKSQLTEYKIQITEKDKQINKLLEILSKK